MRKTGLREKNVNCRKIMYQDREFCLKCRKNQTPDSAPHTEGGSIKVVVLIPYLFNNYINIIENLDKKGT
jgi:hypothetical protein